jgi:hypothetical protein
MSDQRNLRRCATKHSKAEGKNKNVYLDYETCEIFLLSITVEIKFPALIRVNLFVRLYQIMLIQTTDCLLFECIVSVLSVDNIWMWVCGFSLIFIVEYNSIIWSWKFFSKQALRKRSAYERRTCSDAVRLLWFE